MFALPQNINGSPVKSSYIRWLMIQRRGKLTKRTWTK